MEIRVGTSGYAYPDWKGGVYPARLPLSRALVYYEQDLGFDCVEINAAWYRPLPPAAYARMASATSRHFTFVVKGYRGITHDPFESRPDRPAATPDEGIAQLRAFGESLAPLRDAGKLGGLLLQFPTTFAPGPAGDDYLRACRDAAPELPLIVEFRHPLWADDRTLALLARHRMAWTIVDGPPLPGLLPARYAAIGATAYLRLHGRNRNWFGATLKERYDYRYADDELREIVKRLEEVYATAKRLFVFFNNCTGGNSVTNALTMKTLLGLPAPRATLF